MDEHVHLLIVAILISHNGTKISRTTNNTVFSRFGWFLPERFARATPPIKDHWRALTTEEVAGLFALGAADDRAFIKAAMTGTDGR